MKPINFKGQNMVFTAPSDLPNCDPLPAIRTAGPNVNIISCWKMSLRERIHAFISGVIWLDVCGEKPQPAFIAAARPFFVVEPDKILKVNTQTLSTIISTRNPKGMFYARDGSRFVAVDNTTGEAWTEDFKSRRKCMKWLKGKDEMNG